MRLTKNKNIFLLILVLILFLTTRLYKLAEIPASLYWDEASIGYNAYSILKTGKDEWGETFPIHFKAFGEYKLPVYIYTVSFFEILFGLSQLSVRLPSVFFSFGIILLVYSISFKILRNLTVALLASFLITISPWLFIFSRTGYEATAGLFFFLLGLRFWLSFQRSPYLIILSSVFFAFSIYSYNSFRILLPLSMPALFALLFSDKKRNLKLTFSLILGLCLLLFAFIPIITFFSIGEDTRLGAIGIFNNKKTIEIIGDFTKNYLLHLTPKFLFLDGDKNIRSQQEDFGQLFLIEAPFLIFGFLSLLKKKGIQNISLIFFLLVSFIPSTITKEAPHALRSILAAPIISIISAYGIYATYLKIKGNYFWNNFFYKIITAIFIIFFIFYYFNFTAKYNKQSSNDWQYGYKKIFLDYKNEFNKYNNIVISDRYNQPYIFFLFYLTYDPNFFRKEVKYNTTIRKSTSLVKNINKFSFTNIDFYNLPKGKSLIFSNPTDKMDEIKPTRVVLDPDDSPSIYVYEYQK